jgi:tetratricopeptide (TPR) repeat protein
MRLSLCLILLIAVLFLAHPATCNEIAYAIGPNGETPVGQASITDYNGTDVVSFNDTPESQTNLHSNLNNFTPPAPPFRNDYITKSQNNLSCLMSFDSISSDMINFSTELPPGAIPPPSPPSPDAKDYLKAGNSYYNEPNKDYTNALTCYEEGIKLKPGDANLNADLWYGKGNALLKLGRYNDSLAAYDTAISFKQSYKEAWAAKCEIQKALHYDSSDACSRTNATG